MLSSNFTKIKELELEIASLRQQDENTRKKGIESRKSFYMTQSNIIGKIMAIVFQLELVHCRATPFMFNRECLMLDFFDYRIELGLDGALLRALRILEECENEL